MDAVTRTLRDHYAETFARHGATVEGVDWGTDEGRLQLRYEKIAALLDGRADDVSVLDVGCGFGGFLAFLRETGRRVRYTGVDVVEPMVAHASRTHPDGTFVAGDVLDVSFSERFDYVVCNGVLTQKLSTSVEEMNRFAERLIARMFDLCGIGIAFNVMSTHVNFMVDNLYYRDPAELFTWCARHLGTHIRIDHLYPPLHEYMLYVYR